MTCTTYRYRSSTSVCLRPGDTWLPVREHVSDWDIRLIAGPRDSVCTNKSRCAYRDKETMWVLVHAFVSTVAARLTVRNRTLRESLFRLIYRVNTLTARLSRGLYWKFRPRSLRVKLTSLRHFPVDTSVRTSSGHNRCRPVIPSRCLPAHSLT